MINMIYEFYNIRHILVAFALFVCVPMLLFIAVPGNPLLGNYRRARWALTVAYLYLAAVNLLAFMSGSAVASNRSLSQAMVLTVAFAQAVLFMLALLSLLEAGSKWKRYLFSETLLLVIATFVVYAVYAVCSEAVFTVAFYVLSGIYALLLMRYTRLFMTGYRQFRIRMDNYFSDLEAGRMRWAAFSALAVLGIGIMALLSAVFPSILAAFSAVYSVFYIWFAIRFINYSLRFHIIEHALENEHANEIIPPQNSEPPADNHDNPEIPQTLDNALFDKLEQQLEQWAANKRFTEKGITIDTLASEFGTNRSYLSACINTRIGKTFREWMNELRIEETKSLMEEYPEMTIAEIAQKVGFTDKSHLIRQFTKQTGMAPNEWKHKNR